VRTVLEQAEHAAPARATSGARWLERHATPVALALFAVNLALVLPRIGVQSIWFDEAVTLSNAQQPFDAARYMAADATPPLYPLLVHLWMRVFGVTIESARALSVLASAASVVLLFELGRRFLGARSGLFAALLLSCSRCQLFFALEARAYALVVLLCIASFYVFLALLEAPTRRRVVLLGLLDAALLYTHYVTVFALVAQGLAALLVLRRSPATFLAFVASQAIVVVLVLPLALFVATLWPLPMAGWLATPGWRSFPVELAKLVGSDLLLALESVLVLGGAAWLARWGGATPAEWGRLQVLALWVLAPLLAAFAVSFAVPMFLGRYLIYAAPGIFLLVGAVAARLPVTRALSATLVVALCALSLAHAYREPLVRPGWRDAAVAARDGLRGDGMVIVVPAYQLLPFAYHFAPRHFADPARLPELLAAERVVGVAHLTDVAPFAASGRDLTVLFPEAMAPDVPALRAQLATAGYRDAGRRDLPGLVLLRFAHEAGGAAS